VIPPPVRKDRYAAPGDRHPDRLDEKRRDWPLQFTLPLAGRVDAQRRGGGRVVSITIVARARRGLFDMIAIPPPLTPPRKGEGNVHLTKLSD
jgi:hypothetical protein